MFRAKSRLLQTWQLDDLLKGMFSLNKPHRQAIRECVGLILNIALGVVSVLQNTDIVSTVMTLVAEGQIAINVAAFQLHSVVSESWVTWEW